MEKQLVTLRGGRSDGEILAVEPTRLRILETHERGEQVYEEGSWGGEGCPPVTTRLVEFEVYERVDAVTFRLADPGLALGFGEAA